MQNVFSSHLSKCGLVVNKFRTFSVMFVKTVNCLKSQNWLALIESFVHDSVEMHFNFVNLAGLALLHTGYHIIFHCYNVYYLLRIIFAVTISADVVFSDRRIHYENQLRKNFDCSWSMAAENTRKKQTEKNYNLCIKLHMQLNQKHKNSSFWSTNEPAN